MAITRPQGEFVYVTNAASAGGGGLTNTELRASAVPISVATIPSHNVTNAGTFATQATLAAETTKVIGTVNIANESNAEYETVAASQTAQVLGASGATGDYIHALLIVPATTSPGQVLLLDNATSITIFVGGTVVDVKPFLVFLQMKSVSGAWKVTTGTNVSVIGIGNFT